MSSTIIKLVKPASLLAAVIFLAILAGVPATAQAQAGPLGNPAAVLLAERQRQTGQVVFADIAQSRRDATRQLVMAEVQILQLGRLPQFRRYCPRQLIVVKPQARQTGQAA